MSVGIGICSVNRPEYAEKCVRAIVKHCGNAVDQIYLYNDGSDAKFRGAYERAYKPLRAIGAEVMIASDNHGVAYAKNQLLGAMIDDGLRWVLIAEDDIIAKAPEAITEYIRIAQETGISHLSWACHGPANHGGPVEVDGDIAYYFHSVGAWSLYSRESLEDVGLFDENFHNAWEHCELTLRLAQAGYTSGAYRYADARYANNWLSEIPGSIERSSIRVRSDWSSSIHDGLRYWRDNKPDTYALLFGSGTPLEAYAQSIIGGS